jgi:uncharacterized protein YdaU (DUF1376 family)
MADWYPFYPLHYRKDTHHFTLAEHGAYRKLLDEYMMQGGPLPADAKALAHICGCSAEDWEAVAVSVVAKFKNRDGKLFHKRCEDELMVQQRLATARHASGVRAARKRWNKQENECAGNAQAMRNHATLQKKEIELTAESLSPQPVDNGDKPKSKLKLNGDGSELARLIREKGWLPSPSQRPR